MIDHQNINRTDVNEIYSLANELITGNHENRLSAQYRLIEIGKPAIPVLLKLLKQPQAEIRRASASILGEINDPTAIPALIELLEDDAFEVRWRAAESLINTKRDCLIPLLENLTNKERFSSERFLEGAHHILRILEEKGYLGPSIQVLEAFESIEKEVDIPWAAEKALEILKS